MDGQKDAVKEQVEEQISEEESRGEVPREGGQEEDFAKKIFTKEAEDAAEKVPSEQGSPGENFTEDFAKREVVKKGEE